MGVRGLGIAGGTNDELAGHTEMDEEPGFFVRLAGFFEGGEYKFAVTADFNETAAGQGRGETIGIVYEIGPAETDIENYAAGERTEAADNGFDFGEFGHERVGGRQKKKR